MPDPHPQLPREVAERLANLEARVARLESYAGVDEDSARAAAARRGTTADELEFEVGQNWFARVGIIALAAAGGYMLTLPYPELPAAVPALTGLVIAATLFATAHFGAQSFPLVSSHLRGAAMALMYCAVLRLSFWGERPVLQPEPLRGGLLLAAASALNLAIAWRRGSPWLMALALCTAPATALAVNVPSFVLPGVMVLALLAVLVGARPALRLLYPVGVTLTHLTYFAWAAGNPVFGHPYHWVALPPSAPLCLLLAVTIAGLGPLAWKSVEPDAPALAGGAALNCAFGYGAFLIHSYAVGTPHFAVIHLVASTAFLWLAAIFWLRHRSQIATFFYAMCGYAALTLSIVQVFATPDVFVWLSAESVLVVATAVWFQSRFIVVANFLIFAAVVLAYLVYVGRETGVSLGFGVVALASARILNWQRHRLALKTELMRNAYLLSALAVFPYALAHLVGPRFVALTWVALAVIYYGLNVVIRNQKYRWMAHATLVLTTGYLLVPSHPGLTPAYRVASFLALGAAFLVVSLTFTQSRRRNATANAGAQCPARSAAVAGPKLPGV